MIKIIQSITVSLFLVTVGWSQTVTTFTNGTPDDAIVLDNAGNIYCSNYVGDTVFKFTPNGDVSSFITGLSSPNGLAFNSNQELYVCDGQGNTIYKYDIDGNLLASYPVTGHPSGIIKSFEDDSMIFTLYNDNVIKKLDTDDTITDISNAPELSGPVGIAYSENGTLFVGNYNNRIIYKVLSNGDLEYIAQLPTDGGPLPNLGFIAYGQGRIWGTTMGSDKIFSVNPNGVDDFMLFAGSIQGSNDGDISKATFNTPNGIYFDESNGIMYVTDFGTKNLRIITGILGIETNNSDRLNLKFYPNPAKNSITISGSTFNSNYTIKIYDISGKLLSEQKEETIESNFSKTIDVSSLSPGTYFFEFFDGTESVSRKFVKQD